MSLPEPPRLAVVDNGGAPAEAAAAIATADFQRRPAAGTASRYDVLASVPFADGGWLNAQTQIRAEPVPCPGRRSSRRSLMVVAILAIVGFTVRRATRPLAALADSAEAFGRGGPSRPCPKPGRARCGG